MRSTGAGVVRHRSVLAGLGIIGALVLVGCSDKTTSADPTQSPSGTTAATTTTPAPGDPIVHGPTAWVGGQESWDMAGDAHATWTTDPDGTVHARGGWFTCTVTSNDPRVAGTSRYTWNADQWGEGAENGSMVQWGTVRITNSGGAWVGRFEGIYTSETGDTVTSLLVGSGDYAGLSYYRWEYKTFGTTWPTEGLIFPGTMPSH